MFDSLKLYIKETVDLDKVISDLDKYGYTRCRKISIEGDYSLVGEVLIVYPVTFEYPVRIDLSDGKVRSIKSIDLVSFKNIIDHNGVIILPVGVLRRTKVKKEPLEMGEQPIDSFVDIEPGDYVVHIDYGIGKYVGMQRIRRDGSYKDYFVIEFKGGDNLYVDNKELHKIQRYISFHRRPPRMNRLKGKGWAAAKKNATKGAAKTARDFLKLQAKRESTPGFVFSKDTDWQKEIEDTFPYKETPDQLKATVRVKKDMETRRPMDRLLCGDVGYGKTRETDEEGVYKVAIEYEDEQLARTCLSASWELCLAAIHGEPFDAQEIIFRLRDLAGQVCLGPSTRSIVDAARKRGIPVRRLNDGSLVQLGYGSQQRRIWAAETDRTGAIALDIAQDKQLTKMVLRAAGVPVPTGYTAENAEEAWEAANDVGLPVTIKPLDGNQGRGVSVNLFTKEQVQTAFKAALQLSSPVLVEENIKGNINAISRYKLSLRS